MRIRLPDSPGWAVFRLDLRRQWGSRGIRRAFILLGAVLLVQALGTVIFMSLIVRHNNSPGITPVFSMLGALYSPLWGILFGWMGVSAWTTGHVSFGPWPYQAMLLLNAVPSAAISLVMPAYAASALSREREHKRIGELLLAGLTPPRILVAKGGAALLPFAALSLVTLPTTIAGRLLQPTPYWDTGPSVAAALVLCVTVPLGFAVTAGVLLSVSALCRRVFAATIACYAVAVVALPALTSVAYALAARTLGPVGMNGMLPGLLLLCGRCLALAALLPLALRAIRLAGESEG